MNNEKISNEGGDLKRTPEDLAQLLNEAVQTLRDVQPIVNEAKLREAKQKLNQDLFARFNLGARVGKSREI